MLLSRDSTLDIVSFCRQKTSVYLCRSLYTETLVTITTTNEHCKHCRTPLQGKFCFKCGQKLILPEDKKLRHLVAEFFHHFTHLDSKFLITLRNILLKPGKVTRDVGQGITVPHFKLSALFLIGTIIYFLLPSNFVVNTSVNNSFRQQIEQSEFHQWKSSFAEKKSLSNNLTMEALAKRYDIRQHDFGKLLTLLMIPFVIPVLWIISLLIRKFNTNNVFTAYDLGVASLEINSIFLFAFYIISGLFLKLVITIYPSEKLAFTTVGLFGLGVMFLLFSFFKRAYEVNWWQAAICLLLLLFGYVYIMNLYGLLSFLFFI
jgi:hypothetical protein